MNTFDLLDTNPITRDVSGRLPFTFKDLSGFSVFKWSLPLPLYKEQVSRILLLFKVALFYILNSCQEQWHRLICGCVFVCLIIISALWPSLTWQVQINPQGLKPSYKKLFSVVTCQHHLFFFLFSFFLFF